MTLAQCHSFIGYLKDNRIIGPEDLMRVIKQFGKFDRRMGQIAALHGLLKPESINEILATQMKDGNQRFGDIAVRMNYMDTSQVNRILRIQNDDLFLFSQSAVILHLTTMDKILKHLADFQKAANMPAAAVALPETEDRKNVIHRVKSILKRINAIAPLPPTAAKVMSMLNNPDVNFDELGQALALDPGFSSQILKMVNSAFYGLRTRIGKIKEAIVVLGLSKLRQLIMAAAVMEKFRNVSPEVASRFWENAVWTGEWSKELGKFLQVAEPDEMFVSGILHNVGELLAAQYFPAERAAAIKAAIGGKSILEAEQEYLGGTHADLGSYLFSLWQLPPDLVQSTMLHHHDLASLLAMPNVNPKSLIVNFAAALAGIDPSLDDFSYHERIEQTFADYRPLPLGSFGSINPDRMYEGVSVAVSNIMKMFQSK